MWRFAQNCGRQALSHIHLGLAAPEGYHRLSSSISAVPFAGANFTDSTEPLSGSRAYPVQCGAFGALTSFCTSEMLTAGGRSTTPAEVSRHAICRQSSADGGVSGASITISAV